MMKKNLSIRCSNRLFSGFFVWVTTALATCLVAPAHAQNCAFNSGSSAATATYTIPKTLSVPRNAPVGTVVWESSTYTVYGTKRYTCKLAYRAGVKSEVGWWSTKDMTEFPIGDTGLAWSLIINGTPVQGIYDGLVRAAGPQNLDGWSFKVLIKTTKAVSAGAVVPAGILGYYNVNYEFDAMTFKSSNEASVSALSCKTPDVTVKMGDRNRVRDFSGVGTSLSPVDFSIALKECPTGLKKVSYLLKPNTQIVDAARSVVALDAASSAKGVGLQILDAHENPVAMNEKIVFSGYDTVGGNFNIPLKAAYYQTGPIVEGGSANSSLTLVMSYD